MAWWQAKSYNYYSAQFHDYRATHTIVRLFLALLLVNLATVYVIRLYTYMYTYIYREREQRENIVWVYATNYTWCVTAHSCVSTPHLFPILYESMCIKTPMYIYYSFRFFFLLFAHMLRHCGIVYKLISIFFKHITSDKSIKGWKINVMIFCNLIKIIKIKIKNIINWFIYMWIMYCWLMYYIRACVIATWKLIVFYKNKKIDEFDKIR